MFLGGSFSIAIRVIPRHFDIAVFVVDTLDTIMLDSKQTIKSLEDLFY